MKSQIHIFIVKVVFTVLLISMFSCGNDQGAGLSSDFNKLSRMDNLREEGKLVAVTDYNTTSYFVYKGEPMGFQYELLQSLADYLSVKLEVIVSNDLEKTFDYLQEGDCDLIATNLTVTKDRSKFLSFTESIGQTRQVLVQRKPEGWRTMNKRRLEKNLLRNQLDLAGKTIYIQKGSVYAKRLESLSDEIGDSIHVVELPNYETEQLIKLVADGEIEYTICDEIVGMVNRTYHQDIDIQTAVSFPQKLAWAVRSGDEDLKLEIDKWLVNFKKTARYRYTYNKYFKNKRSATIVNSEYFALSSGKVSEYDELFKNHSKDLGWDWKLLASLVYQESNFNPNVRSWAGAYGLMQLMPSTAERFGVDTLSSPSENINAGVQYIKWLDEILTDKIEDDIERRKFVIASYNVGLGHVLDARRLASKFGKDENIWVDNVDYYILNKSNPEFYQDPVVKYGYCRGEEPYKYVTEILERYEHYRNIVAE
jgi:membrane-bound lytic murein transglycosylase F